MIVLNGMAAGISDTGVTQWLFPTNPKTVEILRRNINSTNKSTTVNTAPTPRGLFNMTSCVPVIVINSISFIK